MGLTHLAVWSPPRPYCFPMRVTWKVAVTIALSASIVVACSSSPTVAVRYAQFQFTCCANAEALTHAWHPGQVVTLQWSAESAGMSAADVQHPITLSAVFTGPYASVAALKAGGIHSETLLASPVRSHRSDVRRCRQHDCSAARSGGRLVQPHHDREVIGRQHRRRIGYPSGAPQLVEKLAGLRPDRPCRRPSRCRH